MFKLIFVKDESMFAIQDTSDGSIDICSKPEILNYLKVGFEVGGIQASTDGTSFSYDDTYFVSMPDEDDEDSSDSDLDDEYDEDDYFSSEEYDDDDDVEEDIDVFGSDDEEEDDEFYSNTEDSELSSDENEDSDDWGNLYEDYDDDYYVADGYEETYVNRLYSLLSDEQKDALKRYYLWSSQILFNGAPSGGSLKMTSKKAADKQAKLDSLKKQGQDWVYAGFIDLEFHGAGHCTFGHALRFEHFAWDISYADLDTEFWGIDRSSVNWDKINTLVDAGHVIKFGIDCVGDFFDVPKETLSAIKSMQTQSLAEMEEMCKILLDPVKTQNAKNSFGIFEALADSVLSEETRKKLFGKSDLGDNYTLLGFYAEFKKKGMLYPRSLVKRIQDVFLNRTTHKYKTAKPLSDDVVVANLKRLRGVDTSYLQKKYSGETISRSSSDFSRIYLENLFFIQSGGIYGYNPYSESPRDRDEGMKNTNSRSYFNRITGTSDYDEKVIREVMKSYQGYPALFNQIRGYGITKCGSFDDIQFTPSYVAIVNKVQYLLDRLKGYPDLDSIEISRLERNNGVLQRSSISKYSRSDLMCFWAEYNSDVDISSSGRIVKIGSDVGITTLSELCEYLENRYNKITQGIEILKIKIAEHDDKAIVDSIKEHEESLAKKVSESSIEETAPSEPVISEPVASETITSEHIDAKESNEVVSTSKEPENVINSNNNESSSPEAIFNRCKQAVSDVGLYEFNPKDTEILVALTYAIDNQDGVKSRLDSVNPVICKIVDTLKAKGGKPSIKQMYFVKLGFKEIMKQYDKSDSVKNMSVDTIEKFNLSEHPEIEKDVNFFIL